MSQYVAAYDISRDHSRRQVARLLLQFGRRVQRRVFELDLEPEDVRELKRLVGPWLDAQDAFDLFPIDRRDPQRRVAWYRRPYPTEAVVLV